MRVGSLFSGIGGMDLGLERAGFTVAWQVERDTFCRHVLEERWPSVPTYRDVQDLRPNELPPVDIVCAGFPCQPVSNQGHKKGGSDERWYWPQVVGVVASIRPRYVLLENTTGLLSRGMGEVLGDLSRCGYDAEWQTLSPCYLGAPHHRGRVFILAYPHRKRRGRVHVEPRLFHQEAGEDWGAREPTRGRRSRGWRPYPQRVLRPSRPAVGRVSDGFPRRLVRLRALGNAVVPQVAEWIGRRLIEREKPGSQVA